MARFPLTPAAPGPDLRPSLGCPLLPGVRLPGQLIGIGENYWPHPMGGSLVPLSSGPLSLGPAGNTAPDRRAPGRIPLVFGKFSGSLAASNAPIILTPAVTGPVVCEGELAVVMGSVLKDARDAEEGLRAVAGVTVANDVSARDLQAADIQSTRGKSLDTYCPLGPELVTLDEVPDLQALPLITRINGAVVQESCTSRMVFSVAELLIFCSRFMTLYPGDVILTGTPWTADESVLKLHPGDTVSVEIKGVGTLTNPVVSNAASPA
ncbi:Fumarylacetoacetate (FAA) hydrolase [Arthrobacter sp. 9AX]|uniref:fumarylacetoacetate hydrolase family protein n=1 Tax=Arthrobacter sp. 9AX TaxID=2653131 RepID=UPI0012F43A08|nr:fumarylacetoacetate hydrolase family protein [Arthrobacter sp. 9AX]VXC16568.1 Fumarylacetoacetate (FAA) hydrolase [Arthrobacter sp. 9AX]